MIIKDILTKAVSDFKTAKFCDQFAEEKEVGDFIFRYFNTLVKNLEWRFLSYSIWATNVYLFLYLGVRMGKV